MLVLLPLPLALLPLALALLPLVLLLVLLQLQLQLPLVVVVLLLWRLQAEEKGGCCVPLALSGVRLGGAGLCWGLQRGGGGGGGRGQDGTRAGDAACGVGLLMMVMVLLSLRPTHQAWVLARLLLGSPQLHPAPLQLLMPSLAVG